MENKVENETNDSNTVSPTVEATTTAENTTVDTATTTTATATENKAGVTATVEQKTDTASVKSPKTELPKGVRKELWELRETVRNLREELNKSHVKTTEPTPSVQQEKVDLLTDPDKWAETNKAELIKAAKKEVFAELEQAREAERIKTENEEAVNFLVSQDDVANDEDAKAEISDILRKPDNAYIAQKYPMKAAKMALAEYRQSKGISEERKETVKTNVLATATTTVSSSKPASKKIWTRKEIETALSNFDNPDYAKIEAEIDAAIKERRVK